MALTDTHYVKFARGTPAAFAKLAVKSSDTLYFISEPNATSGILYLGTKIIGDGVGSGGVTELKSLTDVLLSAIGDKQILVYDLQAEQWKNSSVSEVVGIVKGATETEDGAAGLVPAATTEQRNCFLRGDGTWAKADSVALVFQVDAEEEQDDLTAIAAVVGSTILSTGDQAIVKRALADEHVSYTAYVYNGQNWAAMDGNYSADNVYFTNDLTLAGDYTEIGNITKGQKETKNWAVTGRSVTDVFTEITTKIVNPEKTEPSVTVKLAEAKAYEVGETVLPTYTTTFKAGSYTFGPATEVTVSSWTVTDSNNVTKNTATGSFDSFVVADDTNYKLTAAVAHTEGAAAYNNMEKAADPEVKIAAGTKTATSSAITGYRNSFYGTLAEKGELTSGVIRSLNKTGKALVPGNTISVPISLGALRVVFAYPATLGDVTSVKDVNGLNAEIVSAFIKTTINVEGANGYSAIMYNVYYTDYANPNDKENIYTVTI